MEELTEKISEIYQRFENEDFKDDIKQELRTINDYAKALDDGALLIAIMGDVKAGKSTFCNILANRTICQTDTDECTEKPMLITKGDDKYITYKSVGKSNDKNLLFEQILSGIIRNSNEGLHEVDVQESNITEESVIDSNKNANYFLTAFSLSDSEIIDDKVVFADLPGINGKKFQWNWFQETLLYRADYIIFVINSTSAITDSDKKAFEKIYENNKGVMISITMNFYQKSNYDSNDKSIEEANRKLNDIQDGGDSIFTKFPKFRRDLSTIINCGILECRSRNSIKPNWQEEADNEYNKLKKYYNNITENVINKADEIRKPHIEENIINRVKNLINKLDNIINEYQNKIKNYQDFQEQTYKIPDLIKNCLSLDSNQTWNVEISKLFTINQPKINKTVRYAIVKKKIEKYNNELKKEVVFLFKTKIKDICKGLTSDFINKVKSLNSDFSDTIKLNTDISPKAFSIPEKNDCIDYIENEFTKVNDVVAPNIIGAIFTLGISQLLYWSSRFEESVSNAQKIIIGTPGNKSEQIEDFEKQLNNLIKNNVEKYIEELSEEIRQNIEEKCKRKIDGIISNYEDYVRIKDRLIELKQELETIDNKGNSVYK